MDGDEGGRRVVKDVRPAMLMEEAPAMAARVTGTPPERAAKRDRVVRAGSPGDGAQGSETWSDVRIVAADALRTGTDDPEERLRRSSDAFLSVLAALEVMQRQKVGLPAGDARRMGLARYIDELALELLLRNQHETRVLMESAGPPSCEPPPPYVSMTDWQLAEHSLRVAVRALRHVALTSAGFQESAEHGGTERAD